MVLGSHTPGRIVVVDPRRRDYQQLFEHCPQVPLSFLPDARSALRVPPQADDQLWMINCVLPDASGFALLEMLDDRMHGVPVVLVGDEYDSEYERRACSSVAALYVCKPLDARALLASIRSRAAPVRGHPVQHISLSSPLPSSIES